MADGAEMTPAQKAGSSTDPTLLASGGALRPQRARPEAKGRPAGRAAKFGALTQIR